MLFSTPIFLFVFLPFLLGLYFLVPRKVKNLLLLVSSLFFYTWGEQKLVVLIILSTLIDYTSAITIDRGYKKIGLIVSIVFNIFILIYFKYAHFILTNLNDLLVYLRCSRLRIDSVLYQSLPIGISFYTFQTMSYTIDVYKGKVKANYNLINFACYVALFPQLIAGPIVKYSEIEDQLKERKNDFNQFAEGVERFIIGLFKKVLIANNCAFFVDAVFNLPVNELNIVVSWLAAIAFSIQLYFDFSGYSDMAIGLGKMIGFNFPENFNYPFLSKSIQEFWRRWHISLSTWFKDYLYIPLGGNKRSHSRIAFNLIFVFLITGLWHGANWTFVLWGGVHGLFLVLERFVYGKFLIKNSFFARCYLLFFVTTTFVLFRCDSVLHAKDFLASMFLFDVKFNLTFFNYYFTKEVMLALVLGLVFSTPLYLKLKINSNFKSVCLLFLFFISLIYISVNEYNPFIYFKF